jgi:hypothetical protein
MGYRLDGQSDRKKHYDSKYNKNNKGNAPISSYFGKQAKAKKSFNQGFRNA